MDHLIAATIAENRLDFDRTPPDEALRIGCVIRDKPAAKLAPVLGFYHDRIAAMKIAGDGFDTYRQQALPGFERAFRAGIDNDHAERGQTSCDPALLRLGGTEP